MIEREMQELVWRYPERLLNEQGLKQLHWEEPSSVGRSDLVFEDRHGGILVIELKRGQLSRPAAYQLLDYFGTMKERYPGKAVHLNGYRQRNSAGAQDCV